MTNGVRHHHFYNLNIYLFRQFCELKRQFSSFLDPPQWPHTWFLLRVSISYRLNIYLVLLLSCNWIWMSSHGSDTWKGISRFSAGFPLPRRAKQQYGVTSDQIEIFVCLLLSNLHMGKFQPYLLKIIFFNYAITFRHKRIYNFFFQFWKIYTGVLMCIGIYFIDYTQIVFWSSYIKTIDFWGRQKDPTLS